MDCGFFFYYISFYSCRFPHPPVVLAAPLADVIQQLPTCYFVNPPALKTGHLSKFTLEILFYIFYGMPKDALQAHAAQELHSREWRYHVEHQLWFKRAVPGDA